MDLSLQLDVISKPSKEFFQSNFLKQSRPVIIKGLAEDSPAFSKWNFEFFRETMGNHRVPVFDKRISSRGKAYTNPDLYMSFSEFLRQLEEDPNCPYRIFLGNLFRLNPSLIKDFPCPTLAQGVLEKMGFMFFAGRNTRVRMHYDIDMSHVFHTHFSGRKRVILISPQYNELLYKLPFNTFTSANIHSIDEKKFPGLKHVRGYEVLLHHGDTLFIPSGYWHEMFYLDSGFSVSYRKLSDNLFTQLEGFSNLSWKLWTDQLLNWFWGDRWLKQKEKIAKQRADKVIHNLNEKVILSN